MSEEKRIMEKKFKFLDYKRRKIMKELDEIISEMVRIIWKYNYE